MRRILLVIIGLVVLAMVFAMQPARKRTPRKKVEDKKVYLVHSDNLHRTSRYAGVIRFDIAGTDISGIHIYSADA